LSLVELLNQNSAPWSEARTKIFFLEGGVKLCYNLD
jgi:hypothetical protein